MHMNLHSERGSANYVVHCGQYVLYGEIGCSEGVGIVWLRVTCLAWGGVHF